MSMAMLGLVSGFKLVVVILLLLLLKTGYNVKIKLMLVLLVSAFYWIQYESLLQYTGWPSQDDLPVKFILIASEVQEPNPKTGDAGFMYWWVRDSADPQAPPRAYELPYRQALHKESTEVLEQQKKGAQFVGKKMKSSGGSEGIGIGFEKINKSDIYKKP